MQERDENAKVKEELIKEREARKKFEKQTKKDLAKIREMKLENFTKIDIC